MLDQSLGAKDRIIGLSDDLYITFIARIEYVVYDWYFRKMGIQPLNQ